MMNDINQLLANTQLLTFLAAEAANNPDCLYFNGQYTFKFVTYGDERRCDNFDINIFIDDYGFYYEVRSRGQVLDNWRRYKQYLPDEWLECGKVETVTALRSLLYERSDEFANMGKRHIQAARRKAGVK